MWCGDEACEEKIKEKTGVGPAAYRLNRKRFQINAFAAADLRIKWFTGAKHTKIKTEVLADTSVFFQLFKS